MKMEVARDEPKFRPVDIHITLETEQELHTFGNILTMAESASHYLPTQTMSQVIYSTLQKGVKK